MDLKKKEHYGKKLKLLKFANTMGQNEWDGEWSNKSQSWTQDLRQALNGPNESSEDGTFHIDIDNYVKTFRSTTICFLKSSLNSKVYEESETHEFAPDQRVNSDDPEFAQISTSKHMAFFKLDLNEPVNLSSGVFSA